MEDESRSLTDADWLRQIAADRDNDALRLIFADWLEEHGGAGAVVFRKRFCDA
jgi:uncharacterized protein (TIGR02996 family)